jgi:DNA-binding CsgD family transcriptional regulator/tetratricopeptide (TPR) repeat protein
MTTRALDLIERDDIIAVLAGALDAARAGHGSTVMLEAPAGLGKSALVDHVSTMAADHGALVLRARCDELGASVPNGVLQQLWRHLLRAVDVSVRGELRSSPAAPLWRMAEDGEELDTASNGQVASALWWLVDDAAERLGRTIVVVVDDAHLADGPSIDALTYLATRIDDMRCLLVVAVREGDRLADAEAFARVRRAPSTTPHAPMALTVDGCAQLAARLAPELAPQDVADVHSTTGGNPLLVTEVLRARALDDGASTIPPRVVDHVRTRLETLDARARTIATAAAMLGRWATIPRVAIVSDLAPARTEALVDELVAAHVLVREDARCEFRHPLIREAVRSTAVDPATRRSLARRAGDAASADGLPPTTVATLLLDAPVTGNVTVTARLLDGARSALDASSPVDALRFVDRATDEGVDDAPLQVRAARLRLQALVAAADRTAALDAALALLALESDAEVRSELRVTIANLHIGLADPAAAMEQYALAATELEHVPGTGARLAMLRAGGESFGRFLAGGNSGDERHPLLDVLDDDPSTLSSETRIMLSNLALAHVLGNRDAATAIRLARHAVAGNRLLREVTADAQVFYVATAGMAWSDDYDPAIAALEAAVEDAQRRGSAVGYAMATAALGGVRVRSGDLLTGAADLEASVARREDGWSAYLPMSGVMGARAYLALGDDEALRALVDACVPDGDASRWGALEPFAWDCLAHVALVDGRPDRAFDALQSAIDAAVRHDQAAITLSEWRHDAVLVAAQLGRGDEVRDLASESLERARSLGASRPLVRALRASASIEDDDDRRIELLDDAIRVGRHGGVLVELALALQDRGELQEALEVATACGARRIVDELVFAGATPIVTDDVTAVLTPAELRVAQLAATGRTNREIAAELFVTVKAVEFHLSNCYRKLELGGRRELIAALGRG